MTPDFFSFWFEVGYAFFSSCVDMTLLWGKAEKNMEGAAPLYLWILWKERNKRTFNDVEQFDQTIKSYFLYTFVNWVSVYIVDHTMFILDFVDRLSLKVRRRVFLFLCVYCATPPCRRF